MNQKMKKIKQLNGDCLTPVSAFLRLKGKNKCLLESTPREQESARFSMIALDPVQQLTFQEGLFSTRETTYPTTDPLKEVDRYILQEAEVLPNLPFQGGAIGYAAYDLAANYEDIGVIPYDEIGIPDLNFYLFDSFVVFDHQQEKITIVCSNLYQDRSEAELLATIAKIEQELLTPHPAESAEPVPIDLDFTSNFTQAAFEKVVRQAKRLITEGDIFQVVPSQRLTADFTVEPFDYYRQLRVTNPSNYMYYLDFDEVQVIGSSPESLVAVRGDKVSTNPIAGTRRRGQNKGEDDGLAHELLHDEKERAEHLMLIDLGRNDIGRVAELGTVTVPLHMAIEKYRYVMHIVSLVEGQLKTGLTAMDALKATLPAGTVSGAPKIRAMTRIYQWEPVKRSVYAGAVGYYSHNNQADFAIAIRTMVVANGKAYVQAGAGVVYDSDPTAEYFETLQKAKALLEVSR